MDETSFRVIIHKLSGTGMSGSKIVNYSEILIILAVNSGYKFLS